jgi:uncharacterized membrane protein
MEKNNFKKIIQLEKERLDKLHQMVQKTIEEEQLIIQNLKNPPIEELTEGQKISDRVARFGGSWKFILTFITFLILWICVNLITYNTIGWDPYPFILLNLILSCVAAFQAPIIMMSQNRQEEKDRKRSENDYLINLKAEIQIRSLHHKIDLLQEEQIKSLFDTQAMQMKLLNEIDKKLNILLNVNKESKA